MHTMTTERFNFITRDEFNAHEYKYDQKFEDLTTTMLGEFDKVDARFGRVETRLDSIEIRLGTLSEDMRDVKLYMKNTSKRLEPIETMSQDIMFLKENLALIMNKLETQGRQLDAIIAKAHISPAL